MVQQLYAQTAKETKRLKTPWIALVLSSLFVSLPPMALWVSERDLTNNGCPHSIVEYLMAGIIVAGAFLFPLLTLGSLLLALTYGLRRAVPKLAKMTLWILFALSILNWGLIMGFISLRINKQKELGSWRFYDLKNFLATFAADLNIVDRYCPRCAWCIADLGCRNHKRSGEVAGGSLGLSRSSSESIR